MIGVFEDRMEAVRAVSDLEAAGFTSSDVGFALRGRDVVEGGMATDAVGTKDAEGAAKGMVAGGITGGLLAAAAAMVIPGVGPVLGAGMLWTALGGAAAGTAVGGILGALSGLGLSEEEALFYENELKCGRALVAVRDDARAQEAAQILRRHGGYDLSMCRGGDRADLAGSTESEPPTYGAEI